MNRNARRKPSYTVIGMLVGTVVAFAAGLLLWLATGQPLYLLVGTMGTAVGLVLGAGIDATMQRDDGLGAPGAAPPGDRDRPHDGGAQPASRPENPSERDEWNSAGGGGVR